MRSRAPFVADATATNHPDLPREGILHARCADRVRVEA
jgi:hypothetical protein